MAFGSVSVTTAITSIMSSFDKPYPASAGVLLCIYMDLMALTLVAFLLLYPYFIWFSATN